MVRGVGKQDRNLKDGAQMLVGGSGWVRPGPWVHLGKLHIQTLRGWRKWSQSRPIYFYPNVLLDQTKTCSSSNLSNLLELRGFPLQNYWVRERCFEDKFQFTETYFPKFPL